MKVVLFANTDWYLYNFRLSLAERLQADGVETVLVSPAGPYGSRLEQLGFRWIPAPMQRSGLNPFGELQFIWWLQRMLRRERPEIIHGFTLKCAIYASIAGRLAGVPVRVLSVTGLGFSFISDSLSAKILRPLIRTALRLALGDRGVRLILQNADDAAMFVESRLVEPAQITLIPGSGVNCERFTAAPRRSSGSYTVVLAARLLWDKGVGEYVEAARILQARGHQLRFRLAGATDPANPASISEAEVAAWAEQGLVECIGHVEDMPALYAGADLVVLPSYREGLPKSLIEAAACAKPLITTDVPGCRAVVTHEVDGLLVPVRDALALADAIERLYLDPILASTYGERARTKALATFDEKAVVEQTLAVYFLGAA